MKNLIGATLALLLPLTGHSLTTLYTTQASFEAATGPTEALMTTARQVGLANELTTTPGRNTALGSLLTFDRKNTRLGRSFVLEALQGGGMTYDDDESEASPLPLFDFALSIGDIDNAQDDDWEVRLFDNSPPLRAFGVVLRDNDFEAGEALLLLDENGATLDSVDVSGLSGLDLFVGVVTDFDFFGVRFDEGSGGDDIAIADLRFAVPAATWTAIAPSQFGSLRPQLAELNDGRIVRSGGVNGSAPSVYDALAGSWSQTGALDDPRRPGHAITLLASGRVMVAGGSDIAMGSDLRSRVDEFDPRSGSWTQRADMNQPRQLFSALLLLDGRVLVAGGDSNSGGLANSEVYDPVTNSWQIVGNLLTPRSNFAMARLDDGRVLASGGLGSEFTNQQLTTTEIFDPASGTWSAASPMLYGRIGHLMRRLRDGRLLVVGGLTDADAPTAEVYDPATGSWAEVATPTLRRPTGAVLLPDGRVLTGGEFGSAGFPQPMEIYDPVANAWSPAADVIETGQFEGANFRFARVPDGRAMTVGDPGTSRVYTDTALIRQTVGDGPAVTLHTATLMANGRVLVSGGMDGVNVAQVQSATFDSQSRLWTATGDLGRARRDHAAVLLNDGKVLASGGFATGFMDSSELFNPVSGQWLATGSLNQARSVHSANVLDDGRVVVIGGQVLDDVSTRSVETWDPQSGFWTDNPTCLPDARQRHTATGLLDGRVLIVGGLINGAPTPLAAIYDPLTGACTAAASMRDGRSLHTASLLPNGRVLVAGGRDSNTAARYSAEIYDPATNQWAVTAPMGVRRKEHAAAVLAFGRVLVTGGRDERNTLLARAEIYDPISNRWYGVESLELPHRNHRATVLFDGGVLVHGGFGAMARTEHYTLNTGLSQASRPLLTGVPSTVAADDALTLTGSRFSLGAEAAPSMIDQRPPIAVVRRLDNGAQVTLAVDPAGGWSPNRFSARASNRLVGGPSLITIWSGGVPSQPLYRVFGPRLRLFADSFED